MLALSQRFRVPSGSARPAERGDGTRLQQPDPALRQRPLDVLRPAAKPLRRAGQRRDCQHLRVRQRRPGRGRLGHDRARPVDGEGVGLGLTGDQRGAESKDGGYDDLAAPAADRIGAERHARRLGRDHALHEHGGHRRRAFETAFAAISPHAFAGAGSTHGFDLFRDLFRRHGQIAFEQAGEGMLPAVLLARRGTHRKRRAVRGQFADGLGEFRRGGGRERSFAGGHHHPRRHRQAGGAQAGERGGLGPERSVGAEVVFGAKQEVHGRIKRATAAAPRRG
jgi:hypothetical protein